MKDIKIEINPLKIILKSKFQMLSISLWCVWTILVLTIATLNTLSFKYDFIKVELFTIGDFLIPGITGLSFTLALFTATTRIFSKTQLVDIFLYVDEDNPTKGHLFYRTIAPYIWTSSIWLIVSILALFSKIFIFDISLLFNEIFKIIFVSFVLMGMLSLWSLLITHIQDISLETEREVKERVKELEKNSKTQ